jgi:hypothetical protein
MFPILFYGITNAKNSVKISKHIMPFFLYHLTYLVGENKINNANNFTSKNRQRDTQSNNLF